MKCLLGQNWSDGTLDYYCAPGVHEFIAVSRELGGYQDSTPLNIEVY